MTAQQGKSGLNLPKLFSKTNLKYKIKEANFLRKLIKTFLRSSKKLFDRGDIKDFSYPNMDSFERKRSEGWLPFCGIGHKLVSSLVQLNCVQIFPLQMI